MRGKTRQSAENKQTLDFSGKIEIEEKIRQNAENKQILDLSEKTRQNAEKNPNI